MELRKGKSAFVSKQPLGLNKYGVITVNPLTHLWELHATGTRHEMIDERYRLQNWGTKCDLIYKNDSGSKVFFYKD